MPSLISLLIVFPLAFLAGWMLSKAYCRAQLRGSLSREKHLQLLKAQREIYRRRIRSIGELVKKQKEASARRTQQVQTLQKQVAELRDSAQSEHAQEAAAQNERGLLQIEREELQARIKRLETEAKRGPDKEEAGTSREPELRAQLGALKEKLAGREYNVSRLESQLQESRARISELETNLRTWKHRISPLAQQLQLQRNLIRKSCNNGGAVSKDEPTDIAPATRPPADDLKRIRGIGPGLERRLHAVGIRHYSQLAGLSANEIGELATRLAIAPSLPARDCWIEQAKGLHKQE